MTADELRAIVARHEEKQRINESPHMLRNALLTDHNDRGVLLDLLRALAKGPEYRPGLPTVEQVRAHEARGGWWAWRIDKKRPPLHQRLMLHHGVLALDSDGCCWYEASDSDSIQRYPILPDGTPCGWPGEPDPWAVLEVLRG